MPDEERSGKVDSSILHVVAREASWLLIVVLWGQSKKRKHPKMGAVHFFAKLVVVVSSRS